MFCRKCGNEIPDDSAFCPKCGAAANTDAENGGKENRSYPQDNAQNNNSSQSNNSAETNLICPNCGKPLMAAWEKCMYCGVFNPFNSNTQPTANMTTVTPPPQVVIKREKVVVQDTPKQEENGCAAATGALVLGFVGFFIVFIILSSSCLGALGALVAHDKFTGGINNVLQKMRERNSRR